MGTDRHRRSLVVCWVGEPFAPVHIGAALLVTGQPAVDRLTQQRRHAVLNVGPGAKIEQLGCAGVGQRLRLIEATIVGFLYRVHHQDTTRPRRAILEIDDYPELNEWIDDQVEPIQILSLPPYRPSEVLFNIDQEAYRDLLDEYQGAREAEEVDVAGGEVAE